MSRKDYKKAESRLYRRFGFLTPFEYEYRTGIDGYDDLYYQVVCDCGECGDSREWVSATVLYTRDTTGRPGSWSCGIVTDRMSKLPPAPSTERADYVAKVYAEAMARPPYNFTAQEDVTMSNFKNQMQAQIQSQIEAVKMQMESQMKAQLDAMKSQLEEQMQAQFDAKVEEAREVVASEDAVKADMQAKFEAVDTWLHAEVERYKQELANGDEFKQKRAQVRKEFAPKLEAIKQAKALLAEVEGGKKVDPINAALLDDDEDIDPWAEFNAIVKGKIAPLLGEDQYGSAFAQVYRQYKTVHRDNEAPTGKGALAWFKENRPDAIWDLIEIAESIYDNLIAAA